MSNLFISKSFKTIILTKLCQVMPQTIVLILNNLTNQYYFVPENRMGPSLEAIQGMLYFKIQIS